MTDPIADMLTRIRNAIMVRQKETLIPFSNLKMEVAALLEREGFILGAEKIDAPVGKQAIMKPFIKVTLKYKASLPVIRGLKRVSKPGRRVYYGYREIPKALDSLGILLISTPDGIMTNGEARSKKVGGEVLCEIY